MTHTHTHTGYSRPCGQGSRPGQWPACLDSGRPPSRAGWPEEHQAQASDQDTPGLIRAHITCSFSLWSLLLPSGTQPDICKRAFACLTQIQTSCLIAHTCRCPDVHLVSICSPLATPSDLQSVKRLHFDFQWILNSCSFKPRAINNTTQQHS